MGRHGNTMSCHEVELNTRLHNENGLLYLDKFTSAPYSVTTKSFPPGEAEYNGKTSSRTELIVCLCESVYLTIPVFPFPAVDLSEGLGNRRFSEQARESEAAGRTNILWQCCTCFGTVSSTATVQGA
jgi:hypothetical protein